MDYTIIIDDRIMDDQWLTNYGLWCILEYQHKQQWIRTHMSKRCR